MVDPSQQWPYPQQGQPGPQHPQQGGPQYPNQGQPQYPQQQPPPGPQQHPPVQPQYPPTQSQQYPAQPMSAQPYAAQPYSAVPYATQPYSGPPANPYAAPATGGAPLTPVRRNRFLPALVILGALLLVMAVFVVIVVVTKSKDGGGDPGATAATSQAGPVDQCLVGSWNQTSYQKVVDLTGTDLDKRENIGKVKMTGGGKKWTIKADGTAVEDDSKTVYSGKDDKGRVINGTFSGKADWELKTVGRTIEFAGKDSNAEVVISVDGRKAGTITLEPNLDPANYTCTGDIWRTTSAKDPDSMARFDRIT